MSTSIRTSTRNQLTYLSPDLIELSIETSFETLLKQLQEEAKFISSITSQYDFNDNLPFNGLRTFLKIVQRYFYEVKSFLMVQKELNEPGNGCNTNQPADKSSNTNNNTNNNEDLGSKVDLILEQHLTRYRLVSPEKFDAINNDLFSVGKFLLRHFHFVKLIDEAERNKDLVRDLGDGITVHVHHETIMRIISNLTYNEIGAFYNPDIALFWMQNDRRKFHLTSQLFRLFMVQPLTKSLNTLVNPKFKQSTLFDTVSNVSLKKMRKMYGFCDSRMFKLILWGTSFWHTRTFEHIQVGRQKSVGFNPETGHLVTDGSPNLPNQTSTVECLYISNGVRDPSLKVGSNDSLIIHLHGSGFVILNPDVHRGYLAKWSEKLETPILVPNYAKAPDKPFPHGINDILDVYLYLSDESNRGSIEKLLGFFPRKIILTGDSAGGNLALALTIAINEVNKSRIMKKLNLIQLPCAIAMQYPTKSPVISSSFSRLLVTMDPLLNVSATFNLSVAYLIPDEVSDESTLWFRKSENEITSTVKKILKFDKNPFVSPLSYENLNELNSIPCFVQAAEFDILLDDAISIAKSWKGPIELDIVPWASHGFMFAPSKKAEKHIEKFIDFLAHQLKTN